MRIIRGIAAFLALAALLVGAPFALLSWGRASGLARIDWLQILTTRDDGSLLLGVLTLLGWLVWAVLAASIVIELADALRRVGSRGRQPVASISIPGLALPRALIRGMVVALVAGLLGTGAAIGGQSTSPGSTTAAATSSVTAGSTAPAPSVPPTSTDQSEAMRAATGSRSATPSPDDVHASATLHHVAPGDDLWQLAVSHYGDGTRWRQIAEANRDLIGTEGDLAPGTTLVVPSAEGQPGQTVVVVKKGDTLWSLAEQHLGNPERWPEIHQANLDQIADPDEIDVGWRLIIPVGQARIPEPVPAGGAGTAVAPAGSTGTAGAPAGSSSAAPTAAPTIRPPAPLPSSAAPVSASPHATSAAQVTTSPESTPAPQTTTVPQATNASAPAGQPSVPEPTRTAENPATTEAAASATARGSAAPTQTTAVPGANEGDAPPATGIGTGVDPALVLVGGVGTVLAGGLVAQLRRRRSVQLAIRPVGRRIIHPDDDVTRIATALGQLAIPGILEQVEAVTRSMAPSSITGRGVIVRAGVDGVSVMDPTGGERKFRPDHVATLASSEQPTAVSPVPALVALGSDPDGRQILVDLESAGLTTIELDDPVPTCVAMGLELACSPWADGVTVVAVGIVGRALGTDLENVEHAPDAERAAAEAMTRIRSQRDVLDRRSATLGDMRTDDDTRDAWAPRVYLFGPDLSAASAQKLRAVAVDGDPVAVGVVVAGRQAAPTRAASAESIAPGTPRRATSEPTRDLRIVPGNEGATIEPHGLTFTPQALPLTTAHAVSTLLAVTGSDETTPAPWFDPIDPDGDATPFRSLSSPAPAKEAAAVGPTTSPGVTEFSHPTLLLLGPIELVGAAGPPPSRAERSCIEYAAWLLEHPGATATAMANSLVVAEGTRRSNVSRLRSWLGATADGDPYLPDGYSGRLYLDACVSSDWHRLQMLIGPGVGRVSRDTLVASLQLVRGAPLADAAPGQWTWAEELRTDMSSTIRDIGVVVADGAIADGDIDLARWATARALTAAPEDERLLCCRIKAEHRAGNRAEVERLVLRLTRHARILGIDLAEETVLLIQQVIEGRPRARA